MSDTSNPDVQPSDELRHQVHMAMLEKSESAIHLKDLTVVPLGFAVTIAMEYIDAETNKARIDELDIMPNYISSMQWPKVKSQILDRIAELKDGMANE